MAEIQIHASFPRKVVLGSDISNNVNINPSDWHWVHCLTFPLEEFNALQFSQRPYKWMRYAIGVVVGTQGELSSNTDVDARDFELVDYNAATLPTEGAVLYYHTSDEERRRMFPVDSDTAARTSRADSSNASSWTNSTGRLQFREVVAQRDENMCVLTGMDHSCKAVHLLAHGKGDAYIARCTQGRSRDPAGGDIVKGVDSVRNGLLLNLITRSVVGIDIAFLPTPNFAMDTSDVDPAMAPDERRYTAHVFVSGTPAKAVLVHHCAPPSGIPLRMPDPLYEGEWPPPTVFDGVYASTVLHHFGTQGIKDELAANWAYADHAIPSDERTMEEKRERAEERKACRGPDMFDMLMLLPYIAMPPEELLNVMRKLKEEAEATKQRRVQEIVSAWSSEVPPDCDPLPDV